MLGPVEYGSTVGAHQTRPASRITTLIHRRPGVCSVDSIYGQKVQGEPDTADRPYLVVHLGWDRLLLSSDEFVVQWRLTCHRKLKAPLVDVDSAPGAVAEAVRSTETGRKAALIPLWTCSHNAQVGGELGSIAKWTLEGSAESSRASRCALHPWPLLERGSMSYVLVMPARELGDPVALVVLVVAGDRPLHCIQFRLRVFGFLDWQHLIELLNGAVHPGSARRARRRWSPLPRPP